MASDKQVALVERLLAERAVPAAVAALAAEKMADPALTPGQFSKTGIIDVLLTLPMAAGAKNAPKLAEGIYLAGETVYQVQQSKPKPGWNGKQSAPRMYAKALDVASGKFVYASGAIFNIPADAQPVTVEQAMAFGLKHGKCVKGHPLTDPLSIKLGIGPDCCKAMFGMTQHQLAKQHSMAAA